MTEGAGGEGGCTFMTATFGFQNQYLLLCAANPWGRATGSCSTSASVLLCYKWTPKQIVSSTHRALNPGARLHQSCLSPAVKSLLSSHSCSAAQGKGQGHFSSAPHTLQNLPSILHTNDFQLPMYVFNLAHMVIHGQVRRAHFPFSFIFLFLPSFPPELVNVFHLVTLTLD